MDDYQRSLSAQGGLLKQGFLDKQVCEPLLERALGRVGAACVRL